MDNGLGLRLKDVHFGYPGRPGVLRGLSLDLRLGEKVGLIGANGSGKTTLLQVIVGLLKPQKGEVFFEVMGRPRKTEADFREVRERVGLVFQDADDQLFCPTVAEDVAFGPLNLGVGHAEAEKRVRETLETLGLAGFEERVTYQLSGGEKKLVSLATVLAMRPRVLLLDEPTAGLDETARERIVRLLKGLEVGYLMISHDKEVLAETCTRMLRLSGGRILEA
jgi:cobalt/nickel transport system ATP-binding protein